MWRLLAKQSKTSESAKPTPSDRLVRKSLLTVTRIIASSRFQLSTLSNFPRIVATHEAQALPEKPVLMDYFHTLKRKQ